MKYYISYLQPGEFGNKALWGVMDSKGFIAFYGTLEAAVAAYPNAIRI